MATAAEILAAAAEAMADKTLVIDTALRTITIPSSVKNLGVESDKDVLWLHFRAPSMYGNIDLCDFSIYINYVNANGEPDRADAQNVATSEDSLTFSWRVSDHATKYKGNVRFIVCMEKKSADGKIVEEFNSTLATLPVLEGLEVTKKVAEDNPDIIEAMLARLDALEASGPADTTGGTAGPVKFVESLDERNLSTLRDLETGNYVLYGYFKMFPGSSSTLVLNNLLAHVHRADDGTYMSYMSADGDVNIFEILVDESADEGHTYNRTKVALLDVYALLGNGAQPKARRGYVTLFAEAWAETDIDGQYRQEVTLSRVTENSMVTIELNGYQVAAFRNKEVALWMENHDGVIFAYLDGQRLENDYTVQVTITETTIMEEEE